MNADAHGCVRIQGHGILEPHSPPRLIGEDLDDTAGAGPADGLYPFHIELTDGTETREINGELKCRETEDGWKISELRFDLPEE